MTNTSYNSFFKSLSLLLFLISLDACTSSTFIHHAPIEGNHQRLQEQYDLKISGSILNVILQRKKDLNNNFQLSFSPFKSVGLQVGRSSFVSNNIISNITSTNVKSWKWALGGYHFFEFKQNRRRRRSEKRSKYLLPKGLLIDLYSGTEWKKIDYYGVEENGYARALLKSENLFLEGGVQYQTEYFGIGSTLKFNSLRFKEGNYNFQVDWIASSPQIQENKLLDHFLIIVENDHRYNFMEGSIYLKLGDKRCNFYAGYSRSFQPQNSFLRSVPHIAYAGFNLNIDTFYDRYLKKRK